MLPPSPAGALVTDAGRLRRPCASPSSCRCSTRRRRSTRFLSLLTNVLFNTTLSDMETGYKAFRTEVLRSLDLREDDFAIEPEITAKICKRKLRVYELPIAYYGRTYAEGKKITWRDGVKAVRVLVGERLFG